MSKVMKRISAFLLMLVIATAMMPALAFAEEKEETLTAVYVQVPEDWENPCVWAWDDDGKGAFDAWPGGGMDADPANEDWYYIWLPGWANHVIINANDGNVQTEEQILDRKDAWITVNAADSVDISYERQTVGETPEYVNKFTIHAKVDDSWGGPNLWAWSAPDGTNAFAAWPGSEMKENENGWYTATVPVWVNSIIINGNEGTMQTEDISIDPAEVWVTIDAEGGYDFSYMAPDKAQIPDITVHVMAPSDWTAPCLWAWSAPDGTNVFTTWPGETLEEGENGWIKKTIPGWVNSIIVNGNEGGVQTTDISVETGKDVWIIVNGAEDYEVFYEEPKDAASTSPVQEVDTADSTDTGDATDAVVHPAAKSGNILPVIVIVLAAAVAVVVVVVMKKKAENKK